MGNSKIIFYGETLIDLTGDTVTKEKMLKGITAHDKAGDPITGTCEFDSDTSDATANVDDLLAGFWVPGDGRVNPVDLTMSLAKGARQKGVRIV